MAYCQASDALTGAGLAPLAAGLRVLRMPRASGELVAAARALGLPVDTKDFTPAAPEVAFVEAF
jgi:hypothetical protein